MKPHENLDPLVMGGKDDWNVPILNSEQLYQALKRRGIDTQLVVYPGESHGIARPSFIRDRYERYLEWDVVLAVVGIKLPVFAAAGFYNRWWRYVSTRDMWSALRGWSAPTTSSRACRTATTRYSASAA